jgi:CBS domain-containing protein
MARGGPSEHKEIEASTVMKRDPITISPDASTLTAIETMRHHRISCLPVVSSGRLIGLLTERDLVNVAAELLVRQLRDDEPDPGGPAD